MDKPPFNDLAQPKMSRAAQAVMEEAMQKSCDEQAKIMADVGDKNATKNGQDKNVLRKEEHEKRQVRKTDKEKSLVDWEPDTDYEKGKEFGKFSAKEVADMIVRDYGDVLRRLSKT